MNRLTRTIPLAALFLFAACDDPFGPQPWNPEPIQITLYSASRPAYIGLVSALDLATEPVSSVSIEAPGATGQWDFVLVDGPGGLSLAPVAALGNSNAQAAIAVIHDQAFIDVREAPRDTAAYTQAPVLLRSDVVYVVRSRRAGCGFTTGFRYARMQPVEIDQERGIFRFAVVRNPYCDDRALVPPES